MALPLTLTLKTVATAIEEEEEVMSVLRWEMKFSH
jgi:hypothetical protein